MSLIVECSALAGIAIFEFAVYHVEYGALTVAPFRRYKYLSRNVSCKPVYGNTGRYDLKAADHEVNIFFN